MHAQTAVSGDSLTADELGIARKRGHTQQQHAPTFSNTADNVRDVPTKMRPTNSCYRRNSASSEISNIQIQREHGKSIMMERLKQTVSFRSFFVQIYQ